MADCTVTNFAEKESCVADILLDLVDLIPRFDSRNRKPRFPTWNMKRKRHATRPSRCAEATVSFLKSILFQPNFEASPPVSPLDSPSSAEDPCQSCSDGILIELNKNPDEMFTSEDLDSSPSENPFEIEEEFQDEIFMDTNKNSEEVVPLDGDELKFEFIEEVQCCKPTRERKRKREESMILLKKVKRRRIDDHSFQA